MRTVVSPSPPLSPQPPHIIYDCDGDREDEHHNTNQDHSHIHSHSSHNRGSRRSDDCCGHDHDDVNEHSVHHCGSHAPDHGNTHQQHEGGCGHSHTACGHSHTGWKQYAPHGHSLHMRLAADKRALSIALSIQILSFVIQLMGAIIASSSMLVVESLHSLVDGLTVVLSLISTVVAAYPPTTRLSYGYGRAEVLSALLSLVALAMLCIKLAIRAFSRLYASLFGNASDVSVNGRIVVLAETVTLTGNVAMAIVLSRSATSSLNIRAVRAHVIADSLENFVVLIAGAVIWVFPNASLIDPLLTVLVVIMLVTLNFRIAQETVEVIMQAAPVGVIEDAYKGIDEIGSIVKVDSLHAWTVTTGVVVASARVFVPVSSHLEVDRVRGEVRNALQRAGAQDTCVEVALLPSSTHELAEKVEGKTMSFDNAQQDRHSDDEITVSLVKEDHKRDKRWEEGRGSLYGENTDPYGDGSGYPGTCDDTSGMVC